MTTFELLQKAKSAKGAMTLASTDTKNAALLAMADALVENQQAILAANALDLEAAKGTVSDVMLDRLALSPERIEGMAQGIREVAELPDPVGAVLSRTERPNGLVIEKTAVPMGVIAIIYESRHQDRHPGLLLFRRIHQPQRPGGAHPVRPVCLQQRHHQRAENNHPLQRQPGRSGLHRADLLPQGSDLPVPQRRGGRHFLRHIHLRAVLRQRL